ncbi:cystathionine beta-lyase [Actinomycetes bacterium]|nr:cystathionine beta-lyase [Actinomycetes bacterium]
MNFNLTRAANLDALQQRTSAKWRFFDPDVIPAWIAEMDYPLAPAIAETLHAAVDRSDTGYRWLGELPEALADFAADTWGWQVDPAQVIVLPDVLTCIAQAIAHFSRPRDAVVINTPVYPPFFSTVRDITQRTLVEVPLLRTELGGYDYDVASMEQAFARTDVSVYLLCSPHNPTGSVPSRETLEAIADAAKRHGVSVIADEIHAPLTHPGVPHTPFLSIAPAGLSAISLISASKAWNIAGLKCAQLVAADEEILTKLQASIPLEVTYGTGHFGVLASIAAYRDSVPWLDEVRTLIAGNSALLREMLTLQLPEVSFAPPSASYLAWLDFGAYDLGDDPAAYFVERAKVGLSPGPGFGDLGVGCARLNFGTSPQILAEIVERLAMSINGEPN